MEAAVRAKTTTLEGVTFVRDDGTFYGVIRPSGNPDQQTLVSEYEIYRGDLAQILVDLTKDNNSVKYIFNEQIASMRQENGDDGVFKVEFANGTPASEFDLVVACDGATSRTRAMGFNCGVRDHVEGINSWTAYFSIDQDLLKGSKIGQGYSAPGGRFVTLHPDPSRKTGAILIRIYPRNEADAMIQFREALKGGDASLKEFIRKEFQGGGWKYDEILDEMMESDDLYASETLRVKVPSLSKGRFVVVGDAGYAAGPTGGGTSLALAGAYMLAGEISKNKSDLTAALQGYEEQMRPIIDDLQKIPPFAPWIVAPQSAWAIWLRNNIIAFIVWTGVIGLAQKYLASAFAETEKFKLPEYDWEN